MNRRKITVETSKEADINKVAEKLIQKGHQIIHVLEKFNTITIITDDSLDEIEKLEGVEKVNNDGFIHVNF